MRNIDFIKNQPNQSLPCPTAEKFLLAWAEMAGVGMGDGIDTSQTLTLRGALS